jgi:hypothetical protein
MFRKIQPRPASSNHHKQARMLSQLTLLSAIYKCHRSVGVLFHKSKDVVSMTLSQHDLHNTCSGERCVSCLGHTPAVKSSASRPTRTRGAGRWLPRCQALAGSHGNCPEGLSMNPADKQCSTAQASTARRADRRPLSGMPRCTRQTTRRCSFVTEAVAAGHPRTRILGPH